jgi:hypothetical protein
MAFFSKTNLMIKLLTNFHSFVLSQKRRFFRRKYFKIIASVPGRTACVETIFPGLQEVGWSAHASPGDTSSSGHAVQRSSYLPLNLRAVGLNTVGKKLMPKMKILSSFFPPMNPI